MKRPEWKQVQRYPSGFRFPYGESFAEMQVRITTGLARLRARHPGGVVVAVSHADPIKAAVSDAMGTHLDLFQRAVISPCSITAIASWTISAPSAWTASRRVCRRAIGSNGTPRRWPVRSPSNSTGGSLAELRPS